MDDRFEDRLRWHKSTRSADSDCVEVAIDGECVQVRDSMSREPVLVFTAQDWGAFLRGLAQVCC
jgi:hypothetical protein